MIRFFSFPMIAICAFLYRLPVFIMSADTFDQWCIGLVQQMHFTAQSHLSQSCGLGIGTEIQDPVAVQIGADKCILIAVNFSRKEINLGERLRDQAAVQPGKQSADRLTEKNRLLLSSRRDAEPGILKPLEAQILE